MALTLAQARTKVDTFLADHWPTVLARQETYFAAHGRYWQGLRAFTIPPVQAEDATPDCLSSHPADQAETWLDVFPDLPAQWPASVRCDVYDGPSGMGYVVTVRGTLNGVTWERSRNVGPLTERTAAWHQVTEGM